MMAKIKIHPRVALPVPVSIAISIDRPEPHPQYRWRAALSVLCYAALFCAATKAACAGDCRAWSIAKPPTSSRCARHRGTPKLDSLPASIVNSGAPGAMSAGGTYKLQQSAACPAGGPRQCEVKGTVRETLGFILSSPVDCTMER